MKYVFVLGALIAGTGVVLGAFGAHALESTLSEERLASFKVGVRYQLFHGLALLAVSLSAAHWPGTLLDVAGWLLAGGVLLFSGSIYVLTLTGWKGLVMVTPLGGVAMVCGWFLLALHVFISQ